MSSREAWKRPFSFCLKSKNAFLCFFFLFLQQLIVASSTIWIVRLSRDIVLGENFSFNLFLYLGSLVLPYLPAAAMGVLLVTWEQGVFKKYIDLFVGKNFSQVNSWSDKKRRDQIISTVSHEGLSTINQVVNYYFGLSSAGLNTILNVLTISFLIDYFFMISYLFSLFFGFFLIKIQNPLNKSFVQKAQNSRIEFNKSILSFWDNVVLGNLYNFRFWRREADKRIQHAIADNISASAFRELISIAISLATFLPTLGVAAYGMYQNIGDTTALAALLVVIPRLFLILSYTYGFLYLITQFGSIQTKTRTILAVFDLNEPSSVDLYLDRIDWSSLQAYQNGALKKEPLSFELIVKMTLHNGRTTIRGKNGSGKSSLLLEIKKKLAEEAFYLPAQNHLSFSFGEGGMSTGEAVKKQLEEIGQKVKCRTILLDEWDANLDGANQDQLSQLIDEIARTKCVLEVRHRS